MDAKFTPGPLVTRRINSTAKPFAVITPNGRFGDEIVAGHLLEADASLYAAAPDLFDACRMLVGSYVEESGTYALGELYEARKKAQAALSAALGDQP